MLNQGFMGSDLSYEELLLRQKWSDVYTPVMHNEDAVLNNQSCYHLVLTAKNEEQYARREIWVEKQNHIVIQEYAYDANQSLQKIWRRSDIRTIDGRAFPHLLSVHNTIKKQTQTTITLLSISQNSPIPDHIFSLRWLER